MTFHSETEAERLAVASKHQQLAAMRQRQIEVMREAGEKLRERLSTEFPTLALRKVEDCLIELQVQQAEHSRKARRLMQIED